MELRQLEYFIAVIDHGGVGRAAQALHVAQPTISQALRALERELNVELFVRTGRRLIPSTAGLALAPDARNTLGGVLALSDRAKEIQDARTGVVTISTMPELSSDAVVSWASEYIRRHRNFHFVFSEEQSSTGLVSAVENGQSEMGFSSFPIEHNDSLVHEELSTQRLLLVGPPNNQELRGIADSNGLISVDELPDIPIVVSHLANMENTMVSAVLGGANPKFSPHAVVPNRLTQLSFVMHGEMFTFLPLRMAMDACRSGAQIYETSPIVKSSFGILHRSTGLSTAASQLVEACRSSLGEWNRIIDSAYSEQGSYAAAVRSLA
ncbi:MULTISPECIES: LysR family transcriptional regulator [unclassified Brevibacterium]|uniref:LysR family transcriptional regulator n=1 Tax=unclassified Brevibacterium TaxID=2614124 RepID=UPI001E59CE82|nr:MULTISPECIES: LysR family transcriptional regulator [unclassified Brevibacterium]MCD1286065.1 LysR family transcriptional regulator [Brevibacterium sp. CCUG 69071]MDK8433417.1 LysR family transcriptional regulator [Brevibacterium sp. H-BE7]